MARPALTEEEIITRLEEVLSEEWPTILENNEHLTNYAIGPGGKEPVSWFVKLWQEISGDSRRTAYRWELRALKLLSERYEGIEARWIAGYITDEEFIAEVWPRGVKFDSVVMPDGRSVEVPEGLRWTADLV